VIAGIGNLYADEILFRAGMHPATAAVSLSDKDLRRLFRATRMCWKEQLR
jgi:Formamidopyrimidine-DNA glycosylase